MKKTHDQANHEPTDLYRLFVEKVKHAQLTSEQQELFLQYLRRLAKRSKQ